MRGEGGGVQQAAGEGEQGRLRVKRERGREIMGDGVVKRGSAWGCHIVPFP